MAKLETLQASFNSGSIPTTFAVNQAGGAVISSNRNRVEVLFPASATSATVGSITSKTTYDLTTSYAFIHAIEVPSSSTAANAELRLFIDDNNWIRFVAEEGILYMQKKVAGVKTNVATTTYSSVNHAWWRIRESAGTIFWETSKDGVAWLLQAIQANPMTVTALYAYVAGSCYQNESNAGSFFFDDFNTSPPSLTTISNTLLTRRSPRARTVVEILDMELDKVTEVKNLYPINRRGMILRYSKELSNYGECVFRVSTRDPIFTQFGDIIIPHRYHVRIRRANTIVWQGTIVENSVRNRLYQEVIAYQYLYYFDKVLVKRTSEATSGEGIHYRTFDAGTMSSAVSTVITEMKAALGTSHILASLTQGTIDNPNYPYGFTNSTDGPLTGPWNFSTDLALQFDYHSVFFVLQAFANYGKCDFGVDDDLAFQFKTFLGNKQTDISFTYGVSGLKGNIIDYNIPRSGRRMANDLYGIAAGNDGRIIYINKRDEASVQSYGLLQSAMAFSDVKSDNPLKSRVEDQLRFVKDPENSPLSIVIDETGYPLGQYDIGDIVTAIIKDNVINYNAPRRVVRIAVEVHNTGKELTTVTTNPPRDKELGE